MLGPFDWYSAIEIGIAAAVVGIPRADQLVAGSTARLARPCALPERKSPAVASGAKSMTLIL